MHARASIPAWARLPLLAVAITALIALLIAAPWRGVEADACATLNANIDTVRRGDVERRVSDAFVLQTPSPGSGTDVAVEHGDFSAIFTLESLRSCLGPSWSETHITAEQQRRGDAWTFIRSGMPVVMYVQSRSTNFDYVKRNILIQRPF